MAFPRARRAPSLVLLLILASCADQAEGERCDTRSDDDCESGLECIPADELASLRDRENTEHAGLCCPEASESSVDACIRAGSDIINGGGSGGTSGSTGGADAAAAGTGGSAGADAAVRDGG